MRIGICIGRSIDFIADYGCIQSRNLSIIAVGKEAQYHEAFRLNVNYFVAEPFRLNDIEEYNGYVHCIMGKQVFRKENNCIKEAEETV